MHSIVTVTWNSVPDLSRLIDSMLARLERSYELIVVDNASGDQPGPELERWPGPSRFIQNQDNKGFGAACNQGVAAAAGEAVILLNPDTELLDAGLASLGDAALETEALIGPRVLDPGGARQPSASGPVVGAWPWVGAIVPGAIQPDPLRARTEPWRLERRVEVAWLTGACIAARRDLLLRLGPFDPDLELMSEDLDLGLRAAEAGVPSLFDPGICSVMHRGGSARERRFDDAGLAMAARNRRAAIARAYGPARERRAWRAYLLRLRLRIAAKRLLGRHPERERAELAAARGAG